MHPLPFPRLLQPVICSGTGCAGPELVAHLQLRDRLFGNKYQKVVVRYRGMETDCYDTPFATYLTRMSGGGFALGVARLSPTDIRYMLKDHFPDMWTSGQLPASPKTLEITRFGLHDRLRGELRHQVKRELVCALLEYGVHYGAEWMVAVTPADVWKRVFEDAGWPVERVGKEKALDGEICHAIRLVVSRETLAVVRETTKLNQPVLALPRGLW